MSKAYYNEFDPYAAQWLRNLIAAGHIAPGDVDSRSIEDVKPSDLTGYAQCHFFAGIGVWSYALRRAGWSDSRPVWTGSCPCQPFSAAGKRNGFSDERHLWPAWFHLISQCQPPALFGEQVASKDGLSWLDVVLTDLEAAGYARGAVDLCAAGVGAPHIRQRLWLFAELADPLRYGLEGSEPFNSTAGGRRSPDENCASVGGMAYSDSQQHDGRGGFGQRRGLEHSNGGAISELEYARQSCRSSVSLGGMANSNSDGRAAGKFGSARETASVQGVDWSSEFGTGEFGGTSRLICESRPTGPVNGRWSDADWLFCRDGKWRPVEPGTFPLANGAPARVGRLRAYGNAINSEAAETIIRAYMECQP